MSSPKFTADCTEDEDHHRRSCSQRLPNPLDIELIVEKVFQRLEPKYLVECRLVNHTWNAAATHRLREERWRIHLRGAAEAEEYIRLIRATKQEEHEQEPLDLMELALHIDSSNPDSARCIEAALQITHTSLTLTGPPFTFIDCTVPSRFGIDPRLAELISLNGPSLRQLSVHFCESGEGPALIRRGLPPIGPPPPLIPPETVSALPPDLVLPAVRSLSVDYESLSMHSTPAITRGLLVAAPALVRVIVSGFAMSPVLGRALAELYAVHPERLDRLQELELHISQIDFMQLLQPMRFTGLRVLRVGCVGLGVLPRLMQFVSTNCPSLCELQVEDKSPQTMREADQAPVQPIQAFQAAGPGPPQLNMVSHFGFHLRPCPESPWVSSRALADAEAILRTMNACGFTGLRSVSMNFEACIALAKLFTSLGGNCKTPVLHFSPALFRESRWPLASHLTLQISHASVHKEADVGLLHTMASVLGEMFPGLEKLVVNLGSDRVTWKTGTDLGYLLGLIFKVPRVKQVEINDFYEEWSLEDKEGGATLSRGTNPSLQSVAVRSAGRSCRRERDSPGAGEALLNLHAFLELLPESERGVTVVVDMELLEGLSPEQISIQGPFRIETI